MNYDINLDQMKEAKEVFSKAYSEYIKEDEENRNFLTFFLDSYVTLFGDKIAMFDERVHVDNFKFELEDMENNGKKLIATTNVCSDKNLILEDMQLKMEFNEEQLSVINMDKMEELLKHCIEMGLNGYLTSPNEKEKLFQLFFEVIHSDDLPKFTYVCDTCEATFHKAHNLIKHLKETGHIDSIFKQYGYFEPEYY